MNWIHVNDQLPEKDGKYLVARVEGNTWHIHIRRYRVNPPKWRSRWDRDMAGIRYWMPLPEAPNGGKVLGLGRR